MPPKENKSELVQKLKSDRKQIFSQLSRFESFIQTCNQSTKKAGIQERLSRCELLWNDFNSVQLDIDFHEPSETESTHRVQFEEKYFELICRFKEYLTDSNNANTSQIISQVSSTVSKVKLPPLDLPSFSGNYESWVNFYDTFVALIHNDSQLTSIQKFYYLQSCLKGEAAQTIHSIEVTDLNYAIAFTALRERYENKKLIVQSHLKAFFEIQPVVKESQQALRKLLDNILKNYRALKSLKEPVETWDTILIYLFIGKLDAVTKREWETLSVKKDAIKLSDFTDFLTSRCQVLESLDSNSVSLSNSYQEKGKLARSSFNNKYAGKNQSQSFVSVQNQNSCSFCQNGLHPLYSCSKFLNLKEAERVSEVKKMHLCLNCFKGNHFSSKCTMKGCRKCGKPHNTLCHIENLQPTNSSNQVSSNIVNNNKSEVSSNCSTSNNIGNQTKESNSTMVSTHSASDNNGHVLLSTAIVIVFDNSGNEHHLRALLDNGSMSNFMTSDVCSRLNLKTRNINMSIVGINSSVSKSSKVAHASIKSRSSSFAVNLEFLVLSEITSNLPTFNYEKDIFKIPSNISLADSNFNIPGRIDILLGANIFYDLLKPGQIRTAVNMPILQNTKLGWIISGSVPNNEAKVSSANVSQTVCNFALTSDIDKQIEKFWELEELGPKKICTREEQEVEDLFRDTTVKAADGHFIVMLPTKVGVENIGESKEIAIKRFSGIERKLERNEDIKRQYVEFMEEYEKLGHMSKIPIEEIDTSEPIYYLPHHPVVKENSTTTKLRVVYDGSSKTSKGVSLNEMLKTGPIIQDDLYSILIRFRKHFCVFGADIEKMYRQVWVDNKQRNLQRIVWRSTPDDILKHFKLNTITYGLGPSSFLAIRCLHEAANENKTNYPKASEVIKKDFYVDDLLTGASSVSEARKLKNAISEILQKSGFLLRKWVSNKRELFESEYSDTRDVKQYLVDKNVNRTLGLIWNCQEDTLQYEVRIESHLKATKRNILSVIARVFDPLGLIGPVTVRAKIIMQKLWSEKLDWDDKISDELFNLWAQFYRDLLHLNNLNIPRMAICRNPVVIEVHGYCDASMQAYSACLYIRSVDKNGQISTSLLCAKTKVAPMKTLTLPRLELCGAVLLSRLMNKTLDALNINNVKVYYWTDSTIVLSWLKAEPSTWSIFVSHRVAEIQHNSKGIWNHVVSEDNPSDLGSRGCSSEKINNCDLWWKGPPWLQKEKELWPCFSQEFNEAIELPERRRQALVTIIQDQSIFEKFSTLSKLQRVIAYCIRFIKNTGSHKNSKSSGTLSVQELSDSLITLVKLAQSGEFKSEIECIKSNIEISRKSKLLSLNPFLDKNGVLRVGGRLGRSNLSFEQRHQIILPKSHILSKLIIIYEHRKNLHMGFQSLLSNLRTRFWILGGINTIKKFVRGCVVCFRVNPKHMTALMGELPEQRVIPSKPFFNTGVDYAGPFSIKSSNLRNSKVLKAYLCVFVCLVTKAVHLEAVSDLTTESFLNALKRFISRRGKCHSLFSDNGTNFVGANNEMQDFSKLLSSNEFKNKIENYLSMDGITWKFIPPKSPHFGGLWEANVKLAKYHIKRVLGNTSLTFEELSTIFTQIEACINSRPLSPISSDPLDLNPLTPGHFLTGQPLLALPQPDYMQLPMNRLNRYQYMTQMIQSFWQRWTKDCLNEMTKRSKWKDNNNPKISVGDMVLLKEDNLPPLKWALGRVERLFPGTDGIVRVVQVKLANGCVKRAISKICVLPQDEQLI